MTYIGAACVNGKITPLAQATLPLLDRGFLFGHSVFETILVLQGRLILWGDHLARLKHGCARALIPCPDEDEILTWIRETVRLATSEIGHVPNKMQLRVVISGGGSLSLWDDSILTATPHVAMFCREAASLPAHSLDRGISLKTTSETRGTAFLDIKSSAYLPNILALADARNAGFDDAVFVNASNELTECTTASLVWMNMQGEFCTCPEAGNCLPGTTILALMNALERAGRRLHKRALSLDDLPSARALFMVSSVRGAVPVARVDDTAFPVQAEVARQIEAGLAAEQERNAEPLL